MIASSNDLESLETVETVENEENMNKVLLENKSTPKFFNYKISPIIINICFLLTLIIIIVIS